MVTMVYENLSPALLAKAGNVLCYVNGTKVFANSSLSIVTDALEWTLLNGQSYVIYSVIDPIGWICNSYGAGFSFAFALSFSSFKH